MVERTLCRLGPEAPNGASGPDLQHGLFGRLDLSRQRAPSRGTLGPGPARSEELDVWLVTPLSGDAADLRLARDPQGHDLVPTLEEGLE